MLAKMFTGDAYVEFLRALEVAQDGLMDEEDG